MKYYTSLKYIAGVVVMSVVFLLGISVGIGYKVPEQRTSFSEEKKNSVSLMIDDGSGTLVISKDIPINASTTVFDVLKHTTDEKNIPLNYKDYGGDLGVFIESIGNIGKDPSGKKWWQYWVNNNYSQTGVSSYIVMPGDSIEFKFIKGQE